MTQRINLSEMEPRSTKGSLQKYTRKSDKTVFLVKTLNLPSNTSIENFPLIQNCENLSRHSHPNLAKYHGYAVEKENNNIKVLIFFEDCECSLADYLQNNRLTQSEVNTLFQDLLKVLIYIDRHAYALPAYITPNNILLAKDTKGKRHFKLFGTISYDEDQVINEEDLKWAAPEVYDKVKFQRKKVYVHTEKAVFYSLGVLALYSTVKEIITKERNKTGEANFLNVNQEKENKAIILARSKFLSEIKDEKFNKILGKLLVPVDKRLDFRVWQLKQQTKQAQDMSNSSNVQPEQTEGLRLDQSTSDGISEFHEMVLEGKEKAACCEGCAIF